MEAGVLGFMVKDAPPEQLADAVRRVARRERVVDPTLAARDGATVADVARRLFLSEGTVRNHLSAAIAKTSTRNRLEALRRAEDQGWL